jgi:4'-phosphopantetheinyl transferase
LIFWTISKVQAEWGRPEFEPDFLSPPELERLRRLRFPKRRKEWLSGRWAAKNLLILSTQEYAGLSLRKISVQNDAQGAPFFSIEGQEQLPVSVSISHRDDFVFCAITSREGVRLGVDIELVETRSTSFLEDYFTDREAATARQLHPDRRARWITMSWSMKESFLKALGIGLRADTRRVELTGGNLFAHIETRASTWVPVNISARDLDCTPVYGCFRDMGEYVLTLVIRSNEVLDQLGEENWAEILHYVPLE